MKVGPSYTSAAIPNNEAERLASLRSLGILDTPADGRFDDITLLASHICGTPVALISLVDESRQWFKSHHGLEATETSRDIAFCAHAILEHETFIIDDTLADPRFAGNPLVVNGPKIRFYAGSQLRTSKGHHIGTLCVIDQKPRTLTVDQIKAMEALARQVVLNFERQKLEGELRRREVFLNSTLGILPDLVSYLDRDLIYRYANPAYERWFNLSPENIIGKSISEVLGEAAISQAKVHMDEALRGHRQEFQLAIPYLIHGQTIKKCIQVVYVPDVVQDGKVPGFFAVVTDITDLKLAEDKALQQARELELALKHSQESERSFRSIFDQAPMGIIQLDSSYRFVAVNESFCRFLGYSDSELKEMTVMDITHPDDIRRTLDTLALFPKETGSLTRFEKRYVTKAGATVWALVTSRAVKLQDDGETFLFSVIEDVTQVRASEMELKGAHAKLIASAKMASLGEMAGGIAHEINNPLAIIRGKADLLAKRLSHGSFDVTSVIGDLVAIGSTVNRMAKIVRGLRSFSRSCESDPYEHPTVMAIIDDAFNLCGERFKNAGIDLQVDCPSGVSIEARTTQITQIIMNLLNNAFDAVSGLEVKWVRVDVTTSGPLALIRVTDSGPGIPPQIAERMMEPFFTTKEAGRSVGLGLSVSKGIAESHHGRLSYETLGTNTSFVIELPLVQPREDRIQRA